MTLTRLRLFIVLVSLVGSSLPGAAPIAVGSSNADTVLEWNLNASNAIVGVARQPPQAAVFSFAMVQGAVYDAVNAIDGGYQPYLGVPAANGTESKDAAAATAAYRVLVALFPAQQTSLDALYSTSLLTIPDGTPKSAGIGIGEAAAATMLEARTNDGRFASFVVPVGDDPGEWRPTPPGFVVDPGAWAANVRPFLMDYSAQFRSDGPNALTSSAYAEDFNEVREVGALNSATRSADQTDAARFWNDHPQALWNRIFRTLVTNQGLDAVDAARFLGMTSLAAADGLNACWNDKYHWNFWRPITAIHLADTDGNSATQADTGWAPLIVNPPFPDHPSGHGCVTGSIVNTAQNFFGTDKIGFSTFSNFSMTTRSFDRLSHVTKEVIDARVWSGIHFRTADVQGSVIGKKVAHWLERHYFQPVD